MSREHHQRVLELFAATYEAEAEERRTILQRECGDDAALRAEVERMFAHHDGDESFLEEPALEGVLGSPPAGAERPGQLVGRYRLLEEIGSGGFGSVWMAEQLEPVRRKVALKVIKLGMDTKQVLARFEAERQALALMDHPGIAKVFDGGVTEAGKPYFVMELVRGVPITDYCDEARLPLRERLQLFQEVCRAVQHAHQKGVVHRDLKPSNVLVCQVDGRPLPKVIDFGIAKATSTPLTEKTLHTGFRQMVGTPEYMSPEQAARQEVDTRADVYSLGVLLYELLTGTQPFERETFLEAGYEAMLRILREVDPPRPSTRASSLGERAAEIARHRHTTPRLLGALFRGDLDWIVMRALEKDRGRRYATANAFANDVGRYLDDRPVEASPPSTLYRLRKHFRRHRVGTIASAMIAASLAVGLFLASERAREGAERRRLAYDGLIREAAVAFSGEHERRSAANTVAYDTLTAAIELDPDRLEAWWMRVLATPGWDASEDRLQARLADLEAAVEHGLGPRAEHALRAYLFLITGENFDPVWSGRGVRALQLSRVAEAEHEHELALEHVVESPLDSYAEARVLLELAHARTGKDTHRMKEEEQACLRDVLRLLDATIEGAPPHGILHFLALKRRAHVHVHLEDWPSALADYHGAQAEGDAGLPTRVEILRVWRGLEKEEVVQRGFEDLCADLEERGTPEDWRRCVGGLSITHGLDDLADRLSALAVERHPDSRPLLFWRAQSLFDRGREQDSLEVLERALVAQDEPDLEVNEYREATLRMKQVFLLDSLGRYEESVAAIEESLSLRTRLDLNEVQLAFLHSYRLRALALLERHEDLPAAVAEARPVLDHELTSEARLPAFDDSFLAVDLANRENLSRALFLTGDVEEAFELAIRGFELEPHVHKILMDLGRWEHLCGEYGRVEDARPLVVAARGLLAARMALEPDDAHVLARYAYYCIDPKWQPGPDTLATGLAAARKAVELTEGEDLSTLEILASALLFSGEHGEATDTALMLLDLREGEGQLHGVLHGAQNWIALCREHGRDEDVETISNWLTDVMAYPDNQQRLRDLIAEAGGNRSTLHTLVSALEAAPGNEAEAIELCREMLRLDPDDADALGHLTNALRAVPGHEAELAAVQRRMLLLQPGDTYALNDSAWAVAREPESELADLEEALVLVERALELDDEQSYIWNTLGTVLLRLDRFDECVEACRRSVELADTSPYGKDYPENWYVLAMAHHELGDEVQAREALDRARVLHAEYGHGDPDAEQIAREAGRRLEE